MSSPSGREEVTGANVLVAIFAERESHAAYFLQEQEMTRDAVNFISHGIGKSGLHRAALGARIGRSRERTEAAARQCRAGRARQEARPDRLLRQPQREGQGRQGSTR